MPHEDLCKWCSRSCVTATATAIATSRATIRGKSFNKFQLNSMLKVGQQNCVIALSTCPINQWQNIVVIFFDHKIFAKLFFPCSKCGKAMWQDGEKWKCHPKREAYRQKVHSVCKWFGQSTATKAALERLGAWQSQPYKHTDILTYPHSPHSHTYAAGQPDICNLAFGKMKHFFLLLLSKMKINGTHFVRFHTLAWVEGMRKSH